MENLCLFLRKITVPPVFATIFLLTVYFIHPSLLGSISALILGIFFLGFLPILGYPLQKYIPYFKNKGREGQRNLAMLFSVLGYCLGILIVVCTDAPLSLYAIYLEYLLCGITILVTNKVFHIKASGHSCGITAPVLLFLYFDMPLPAIMGTLFILIVFASSIKAKRHTPQQLCGGGIIALCCMLIVKQLFVVGY